MSINNSPIVSVDFNARILAPIDYAPFEVIQHLAWDDEIEVAGSVLAQSSRLGTETLVEIASQKGQEHLLAISGRADLPTAVTDVIVDRGESRVIRKLANNASAHFSEHAGSVFQRFQLASQPPPRYTS